MSSVRRTARNVPGGAERKFPPVLQGAVSRDETEARAAPLAPRVHLALFITIQLWRGGAAQLVSPPATCLFSAPASVVASCQKFNAFVLARSQV